MAKRMLTLSCALLVLVSICTGAAAQELGPGRSPPSTGQEYVPGQLLIRFRPSVSDARASQILAERGASDLRRVRALDVRVLHLPPSLSVERAVEVFGHLPEVEYAEPNYILHIAQVDDPGLSNQWAPQAIDAPAAWDITTGDPSVTIAVVDTGIDYLHSELAPNIWANPEEIEGSSGVDDDGNGHVDDVRGWDFMNSDADPMDDHSHGTHVGGIVAAVDSDNSAGLVGICPACTLMAVKVLDSSGSAPLNVVAEGITYAADEGANVINLSLGGPTGAATLESAVNYAWNQGVLVVAATGNNGAETAFYPASYANVLGVASTNSDDYHSCFSNYGSPLVSVSAPGESIYSTLPRDGSGNDDYGVYSGTSMAAPHVSGLAGLLFSAMLNPTNDAVRSRIEATAEDLGPTGADPYFGTGRINALRALTDDTSATTPLAGLFSSSVTASGYAHARKLARDAGGRLHLVWHGEDAGEYTVSYATSVDGGDSWSAPQVVFTSTAETYHPALAVDGTFVYIAFPSQHNGPLYEIFFTRKPLLGGSWSTPVPLMGGAYDAVRPDLFVDPSNGRLHLVASSLDNAPYVYYTQSSDGGMNWGLVQSVDPTTPTSASNTRYATVHANGSNIYIAARTVARSFFTTYYLHTVRSTDGGQTWFDQTKISSYLALLTGEYGVSLAGVGDRLYMTYEVGGNLYFRRFDGTTWSNYLQLESSGRWPTVTQADDGQAWMIWEDAGSLLMRHYTGTSWEAAETLFPGDTFSKAYYPNLKLGTSGGRVEWMATHCPGAPFRLIYAARAAGVNDPPVAVGDAYSVDEDGSLIVAAPGVLDNDTDAEGDPLTSALVSDVSNGSLTLNADGSFTYTPSADYNGTDSFTYEASDGSADSNMATVTITVNPVQDAPDAVDDSASVDEDGAVDIHVLSNDSDPDGDLLTVTDIFQPTNGTAAINPDGTIHYDPGRDFCGQDGFTYSISDGNGSSDTAAVTVDVVCVNDPPLAADDGGSTPEDTPITIDAAANDSDIDGNLNPSSATVETGTGPANGFVTNGGDGSFTYTPNQDFNGADSFDYRICDTDGACGIATVTISVAPVNDAPLAQDDAYSIEEGGTLIVAAPGVLGNDGDPEGDPLSAVLADDVSNGTLLLDSDGSFSYSPTLGFTGVDSLTYRANDGQADSNLGTVSIAVTAAATVVDAVASSEVGVAGTVSGDYTHTHLDDGVSEAIAERDSGGKPENRYSYLEHKWVLDVTLGNAVTLYANVWSSGSTDGDNFIFAYSTDDADYAEMFVVDDTSDVGHMSYALPGSIQGTVYVRVTDSDHSPGNRAQDTVYIDHLYIRSETQPGEPPSAPSSLSAVATEANRIDLTWIDNAADEYGFQVERSLDGADWSQIDTVGADAISYADTAVSPNTTYHYQVRAYNGSGSSGYSNMAVATTPDGLSLTANGYKVKGVQMVDLAWSGGSATSFDVYRDGNLIGSGASGNAYTDNTGQKGGGSYLYQVCETSSQTNCSNTAQVDF